jgi:outer membrane protein TolC
LTKALNYFFQTLILKIISPVLFGLFLSLAAFSSRAAPESPLPPDSPKYSLDAAVQQALSTSPAIRIQKQEIDRSLGVQEQASGEFDWFAAVSAVSGETKTPLVGPFGQFEGKSRNTGYSASVTRKLRNGVILQPSLEVGVPEKVSPFEPTYGASKLNLQIVVPLLRGLGTDSTGATEAAARGDWEVARLLYRHALAGRAFGTAQAYWSTWAARAVLIVNRDDERRAQKLHEGIRVLVNARIFPPNTLLQSEANLRQKSTRSQEAELAAVQSGFELGRTIGLTGLGMINCPVPDQDLPQELDVQITRPDDTARLGWISRAYLQRADYLAIRKSEVPLRILARQAQLDLKPSLDLSLRAGYLGLNSGNDLVAPLAERVTGPNGEIGLSLGWPVANTYQRGLLRTRRAELAQAELSSAQAQSDIASDVCTTLEEVRLRAATMSDAAAAVSISRKAVEQEQRRLQTGEATVLDVINLENLLSSARISQVRAQSGYAIAVARLRYAIGEIFSSEASDQSFQLNDLTQLPPDEK